MAEPKGGPEASPAPGPEPRVVQALRAVTNEMEMYVAAAGREAEMHRTDLSGLALVMDRGNAGRTTTPGQLSGALHLSASATSAMLDRLERLGHVRRRPHPTDRRSVVVEMTDHAREVGEGMFGPLGGQMGRVLARWSPEELELVARFLDEVTAATRAAREGLGG